MQGSISEFLSRAGAGIPASDNTTAGPSRLVAADCRNLIVVSLVFLAALALARPFAEGGSIDDFSYAHMAKVLGETGRFAYNGWPTAMIGLQVWWAAAWVWLFGFSFTIVRLSVLPLACGAVALSYLLARRATLSPTDSLFAALSLAFTPLFFKLAPTFMTDLPALCFLLGSLYAFVRAIEAPDRRGPRPSRTVAWLVAGTALGIAGGTIRQNVWLAPIVGAACLFGTRGTSRPARIAAVVCGAIGMACMLAGIRWFNSQPYAIPSHLAPALPPVAVLKAAVLVARKCSIQLMAPLAFCLPPLLAARAGRSRSRWIWGGCLVTAAALLGVRFFSTGDASDGAFNFGSWGGLGGSHSIARSTIGFGRLLCRLTPAVALLVAIGLELRYRAPASFAQATRLPPAVFVPLAYLVPYTAVVVLAAQTTGGLFDRYVLPHLPTLTCWLLLWTRRSLAQSDAAHGPNQAVTRSRWGWAILGVAAVIAIADSHDAFSLTRARLAAIDHLVRQGVPRERIMAGIAIDGWEQIERAGFLNDRRIRVPPDAYRPLPSDGYPRLNIMRDHLASLVPEYIVTADRDFFPGDGSRFPEFAFATWLPPYRQAVRIHHQAAAPELSPAPAVVPDHP